MQLLPHGCIKMSHSQYEGSTNKRGCMRVHISMAVLLRLLIKENSCTISVHNYFLSSRKSLALVNIQCKRHSVFA